MFTATTPSPVPDLVASAPADSAAVAWIALAVSTCALVFTGLTAVVNWKNRADKRRVELVLVGLMEEVYLNSPVGPSIEHHQTWTLHNAGEGSLPTPTVEVRHQYDDAYTLSGSGVLHGHGELRMKAARDAPPMSDPIWTTGRATATWNEGNQTRRAPVKITVEASQRRG